VFVADLLRNISPPSSPDWKRTLNLLPSKVKSDSAVIPPDPSDVKI
jgi:hypothetical protein